MPLAVRLGTATSACIAAAALLPIGAVADAAPTAANLTNLSQTCTPSSKGRLAVVVDPATLAEDLVAVYADGPAGAADVLVRRSVDRGTTWSEPVNVSGTAAFTNAAGDPGDAGKPQLAARGRELLLGWDSSYCPGDAQQVHDNDGDGDSTAYFCVRVARSHDSGATWTESELLGDGSQDAINLVVAASDAGFALAWQEDPLGLQPGEAEGPGDGESGAHASPGTDAYYTSLSAADFASGVPFPDAVEISDNVDATLGAPAASRPQVNLVGGTAVLGYEETLGGGSEGKAVRYHLFPFGAPAVSAPGDALSDPAENARRLRIVTQGPSQAGPSDTRAVFLWRQGGGDGPAPADVLVRRAVGGLAPTNLTDAANLTSAALDDPTGADPIENARAHRAQLRGEAIAFVYDESPDEALGAPYDTFIRRSPDGGLSWGDPVNLSRIDETGFDASEPRLTGTPSSIATGRPEDLQDPNVLFVAWLVQPRDARAVAGDLVVIRSADRGETFGPRLLLGPSGAPKAEAQLRPRPDGLVVYATWMQTTEAGTDDLFFARLVYPLFEDGFEDDGYAGWSGFTVGR